MEARLCKMLPRSAALVQVWDFDRNCCLVEKKDSYKSIVLSCTDFSHVLWAYNGINVGGCAMKVNERAERSQDRIQLL